MPRTKTVNGHKISELGKTTVISQDKASRNSSDKVRLSLTDLFKVRKRGSMELSIKSLNKGETEKAHTYRNNKLDEIKEKRKKHYPKDFIAINKTI